MPVEYSLGYRKPPVSGRFQKGQSGNPGGRPKARPGPTRRQLFAQMFEAGLLESVETVATTPCRSAEAAWAKGIILDGVRGKTAAMRLGFSLLDELDVLKGTLAPARRPRPARMVEEFGAVDEAAAAFENEQEADVPVHPVSQRIIEEERLPTWCEYTGEAPAFASSDSSQNLSRPATAGRPDETHSMRESEEKTLLDGEEQSSRSWVARSQAGHDREGVGRTNSQTAASRHTEGNEQGLKTESERQLLAVSCRVPSEKELRRREEQAEMDRGRQAYESARAMVKAFAEKHGYEFPGSASAEPVKDAPAPLTEGRSQGITNPRPEEGPHKRALRARFERLAWAEREEAARKAALAAKAVPLTPALSPRNGGEGDVSLPRDIGMKDPEPLPDFSIWMRGQRATR